MGNDDLLTLEKTLKFLSKKPDILRSVINSLELSANEFKEWQALRLKEVLLYGYKNSAFYRNRFQGAGISEKDLSKMNGMEKIPFVTRMDLKEQYPYGLLVAPMEDIVRYGESTGTTSEPINAFYTREDWVENNCIVASFLSRIIHEKDIVGVIVPYELAMVGQDLDRALELVGSVTIAFGALTRFCPPERMIHIFRKMEVTALICSPMRALFLTDEVQKMGFDPQKDFQISKIFCVGEGVSKSRSKMLKEIWNADIYHMYGMTETNTLAMPCSCGKLHLVENKAFFEVIDPETGQPKGMSSRGELVVTTFVKGMPLIRYRTGDLCTIHDSKCECGLNFRTLEHHGRLQDKISVAGQDIQLLDIEDTVVGLSGTKYFTLQIKGNTLDIGLVLSEEECSTVGSRVITGCKEKYQIEVTVKSINGDKISEAVRGSLKPSILSTLIKED